MSASFLQDGHGGCRMRFRRVFDAALQCLLLLGLALTVDAIANPIDELRQFASDERARLGIPGVSIGLIDGGSIEYLTLGVRRAGAGEEVSSSDAFSIGSISKAVTAWGVMELAERGSISLDAPVSEYLGERWQLPDSGFDHDEVTLRRILSHTAGLSARSYQGFPPGSPLSLEDSLNGVPLASSAVRVVANPGREYRYSGGGFALAQVVVENVTGETFSDYMTSAVFRPLGMLNARYLAFDQTELAVGPHDYAGRPITDYRVIEQGAGGLRASAEDLVAFLMANMTRNRVLERGAVIELQTPFVEMNEDAESTLGFERRGDLLRHGGHGRGWVASIDFHPSSLSGLVILTNSANGLRFVDPVRCKWNELFEIQDELTRDCERVERAGRVTLWGLVSISLALWLLTALVAQRALRSYRYRAANSSFGAARVARIVLSVAAIAAIWIFMVTDLAVYAYSGVRWHLPTMGYLPRGSLHVASALTGLLVFMLCAELLCPDSLRKSAAAAYDRPQTRSIE